MVSDNDGGWAVLSTLLEAGQSMGGQSTKTEPFIAA